MSENLKGAIFMMCSMTCFAVNNAMIKAFGGMVPMFQTVALRGGIVLLLLGLVVVRSGWNVQKLGRQAILARNIIFCGFGFFGYIVSVLAIRMGKVSFTSQSRYSGLLVTLVLGYIFSKSGRIPGR
jgi:S-adenosylmethionine uptake transporter